MALSMFKITVRDSDDFNLKIDIGRRNPTLILITGYVERVVYDLWFDECLFTLQGIAKDDTSNDDNYKHKIFLVDFADKATKKDAFIELYWYHFQDRWLTLKC